MDASADGQKVATAKPCYICKRPTETVLSTIKTEDFLYTCESHLGDTYVARVFLLGHGSGVERADDSGL